jgi:hypothetical protein
MVISQATLVQIPSSTVTPVISTSDGQFVKGITPDGVQQRGVVPFANPATTAGCFPTSGSGTSGAGAYIQTCNIPIVALAPQKAVTITVTMDITNFPQFDGMHHYVADQVTCHIGMSEQQAVREQSNYLVSGYSASFVASNLQQINEQSGSVPGQYIILGNLQSVNADNIWSFDVSNPLNLSNTQYGLVSITCTNYIGYTVQSVSVGSQISSTVSSPTWAPVGLATSLNGQTPFSLPYMLAPGVTAYQAPNISTTKCFEQETGTGSAGLAPTCSPLVSADIPATSSYLSPTVPPWLQYLGNGSGGSNTTASGNMSGEYFYVNFTVPYGNIVTVNSSSGLTIHATGTCTIAGTINTLVSSVPTTAYGGSSGGGGGGGTAAGTAASNIYTMLGTSASVVSGGSAGAASGGAGGSGSSAPTTTWQKSWTNANSTDGLYMTGTSGGQGGSSGGAGGNAGTGVTLICAAITGTDGTHTGIINVSGSAGTSSVANSTGAGGGGGGGTVILSSQATVSTWPTIYVAGGAGGTCGSYTTCGAGGVGGAGWYAEFAGW